MNRTNIRCKVQGVTNGHVSGVARNGLHKLVVDCRFDQKSRAGDADLAGVPEYGPGCDFRRLIEIRSIGEDDIRRFTTKFKVNALEIGPGSIIEKPAAGGTGAGENQSVDIHGEPKGFADNGAGASHDVQDAIGKTCFGCKLGNSKKRQGRGFGRLEHDAVAGCEGRRELPGSNHQRKVPGNDGADHANGLAMNEREHVLGGWCDFAINLVDGFSEVAKCSSR